MTIQPFLTIGSGEDVAFAAIAAGTAIIVLPIAFLALRSVLIARTRERTKRELAAYVAEGSITADEAVAFLRAASSDDGGKTRREIAGYVAEGSMSANDAQQLIRTDVHEKQRCVVARCCTPAAPQPA